MTFSNQLHISMDALHIRIKVSLSIYAVATFINLQISLKCCLNTLHGQKFKIKQGVDFALLRNLTYFILSC